MLRQLRQQPLPAVYTNAKRSRAQRASRTNVERVVGHEGGNNVRLILAICLAARPYEQKYMFSTSVINDDAYLSTINAVYADATRYC